MGVCREDSGLLEYEDLAESPDDEPAYHSCAKSCPIRCPRLKETPGYESDVDGQSQGNEDSAHTEDSDLDSQMFEDNEDVEEGDD